jgi:hypothetical protein
VSAPEGVPFPIEAEMLATADTWTLTTRVGGLDLMFLPAGTRGYDDLRNGARQERIAGVTVTVAALADVIRSEEAANREKDNMHLPILRRTLEQTRVRGRGGAGAPSKPLETTGERDANAASVRRVAPRTDLSDTRS